MAEIQDGHHFKARRNSSRPISQEPAIGSARDRMQIEGRAEGEFYQFSKWPKSKMATTLRLAEIPVGRFRRNQRSDRLGTRCNFIEGRAEGEFYQFSKWPKSKMATTLRLAEIPVGRFRRNQRSDRPRENFSLGWPHFKGCKSKVEPRGNFINFQNGRNPRWPPL